MENKVLTKVSQLTNIPALRLDILKIPNVNINIRVNTNKKEDLYNAPIMSVNHPCHSQK